MYKDNDKFEAVRAFYDDEYYARIRTETHLPWHTRKVAARLGDVEGKEILDVACGLGDWLGFFYNRGARIAGIDLSKKAIDKCVENYPGGDFRCGAAENLPFCSSRFDLVSCVGSLEHFLDKPRSLAEMRRVAKSGARFLILVPNAGFLTRRLGLYRGTEQVHASEEVLELDSWAQLFHGAGLEVLHRWRDLHPLSWSWIAKGKKIAWPVRTAQALALPAWPVRWQYQVYHYCRNANA